MVFIPNFSTLKGEPQDQATNDKQYAETQQQRALERRLREEKRDLEVMKAQGAPAEQIKAQRERVRNASADIDEFCDKTGLPRRRNREYTPINAEFPENIPPIKPIDTNNPPINVPVGGENIPPTAQAQTLAQEAQTANGIPPLTKEQADAIEGYVSGEDMYINQQLRGRMTEPMTEREKLIVKNMDAGLDVPLGEEQTLWRSVDADAVFFGKMSQSDYEDLRQYLAYGGDSFGKGAYADSIRAKAQARINLTNGRTIVEKGYMSTTLSKDVAFDWYDYTGSEKPIVLRLNAHANTHGRLLSQFEVQGQEQYEVLLMRNTKYTVTKITAENGQIVVYADIVDDTAKAVKNAASVAKAADDVVDAVRPVYSPASTIEEAEKFAESFTDKNRFGAIGVSYKGVGLDVANEANKTISEFYNTYNVDKFGGIVAPAGNTKLGKQISGAYAGYSPMRHSFVLNRSSLKSTANAVKEMKQSADMVTRYIADPSRFKVESKAALEVLNKSAQSGRAIVPTDVHEAIMHELGHALEKPLRKVSNYDTIKAGFPVWGEKISGYAASDYSEYIAESFAAWNKGESIDPELIAGFEALKR